jgi:NTP pyrophosphatase (non-canonical NTP hydrolase)
MNRLEYLLTCLAEECSELAIECSKSKRFGLDSYGENDTVALRYSNSENLVKNFVDVYAIIKMLDQEGYINSNFTAFQVAAKIDKVNKYYNISKQLGYVVE